MMPAGVLRHLRCPLCGEPLAPETPAPTTPTPTTPTEVGPGTPTATGPDPVTVNTGPLRCPRGHSFDRARQGYVDLRAGRTAHTGDSAEMIAAREDFLGAGHYGFISSALARAAAHVWGSGRPGGGSYPPLVVDAGAGTGRHLAAVLDALPAAAGLALDISKPALRRAARAHPRAGAAGCDTWGPLPLADASAGLLLNAFAPRNGAEFHRVLHPDGRLLVVTPAADHLGELVQRLSLLRVDPGKAARLAASLSRHFVLTTYAAHRRRLTLTREEVRTLVEMGPSAWHRDPALLTGRLATLPEPVDTTASIRLSTYRPR